MRVLKHDQKLLDQVQRGTLAPEVAALQVLDPVLSKRLFGRARYLRRCARNADTTRDTKRSANPVNPRFLKHIERTRARKWMTPAEALAAIPADAVALAPPLAEVIAESRPQGTP